MRALFAKAALQRSSPELDETSMTQMKGPDYSVSVPEVEEVEDVLDDEVALPTANGRRGRGALFAEIGRIAAKFAATLVAASAVTFTVFHVFLDPVDLLVPLSTGPEARAALRHSLGLDRPLPTQYFEWLWNALHGDFGESIEMRLPAGQIALTALGWTAQIVVPAVIIGSLIGLIIGLTAAAREGSVFDRAVNVFSYGLLSLHEAWITIMIVLVFAILLGAFPSGGVNAGPLSYVLPIAALSINPVGQVAQLVRSSVLEEGRQPYIETAIAKGASPWRLLGVHQLKGAIPPVSTYVLYDFGKMFVAGAIIVETIFSWPGIGALTVQALRSGDVFLIQCIVLICALLVATLNLLADILHLAIDPRVRASGRMG